MNHICGCRESKVHPGQVTCLSIHVPLPRCINFRDIVLHDYLIDPVLLHSSSYLVFLRRFLMVLMIYRLLPSLTCIFPFHTSGMCVRMRKRKLCSGHSAQSLSPCCSGLFPGDSVNMGSADRQPQSDVHSWLNCSSLRSWTSSRESLSRSFLIYRVGKMMPSTE